MKQYHKFIAALILVIFALLCTGCQLIDLDTPKETYSDTTADSFEATQVTQQEETTDASTSAPSENTQATEAPTESIQPTEAPTQPETIPPTEQATDPQETTSPEYIPDEDEGPAMPL